MRPSGGEPFPIGFLLYPCKIRKSNHMRTDEITDPGKETGPCLLDPSTATRFDGKAPAWDADEGRRDLAADIVRAVEREWPEGPKPRLLDYGAGTGLCSLPLASKCASVVAMDVSSGMLARLEEKAHTAGMGNIRTLRHDLSSAPLDGLRFDVIVCAMTLHHVEDTGTLLARFHSMLDPGGFLAIADLDTEDGSFHQDPAGVHHTGFSRDGLAKMMMAAGFTYVGLETVHRIRKQRDAVTREYPVFISIARINFRGDHPERAP